MVSYTGRYQQDERPVARLNAEGYDLSRVRLTLNKKMLGPYGIGILIGAPVFVVGKGAGVVVGGMDAPAQTREVDFGGWTEVLPVQDIQLFLNDPASLRPAVTALCEMLKTFTKAPTRLLPRTGEGTITDLDVQAVVFTDINYELNLRAGWVFQGFMAVEKVQLPATHQGYNRTYPFPTTRDHTVLGAVLRPGMFGLSCPVEIPGVAVSNPLEALGKVLHKMVEVFPNYKDELV